VAIFERNIEKIEEKNRKKRELEEGIKKLKAENLPGRDIIALIVAMFQLVLPFALGIIFIYFLIMLFLTQVWL
jgi:ABC-type multidrug transport system permease subunit